MCGIVGYIGPRPAPALLIDGLKRLEYRGYDSCGIAVLDHGTPRVLRAEGRIAGLEAKLESLVLRNGEVACGIGHTRWATHGRPGEANAHPHRDCSGNFVVCHNGIIENFLDLRRRLTGAGHSFSSQTDTEVVPHLIETFFQGNLEEAVRQALREVEGVYGLVVISPLDPGKIVAARKGAALVLGFGEGENFVASDASALLAHTRDMLFLEDGDMAVVRDGNIELFDLDGRRLDRAPQRVSWSAQMAEKDGYPHFMLKEIFEQPRAVRDTLRGRVTPDKVTLEEELGPAETMLAVERVRIVACGTSLHAGHVGKFLIESLGRIPVEVDYASEFRYRDPLLDDKTLVIAITQSGETADTLAAMEEARGKGARVLSVCNVIGSAAARNADHVLYTHAGPEIGVASTKAFVTQLAALHLVALHIGQARNAISPERLRAAICGLRCVADQMERLLEQNEQVLEVAQAVHKYPNFLYLARGVHYPIALEGALKLKEISYIHAEGYPAGEMKHGPIALIDAQMPVVVIAPQDPVYRKTMGNIEEVKVRGGIVVAVGSEGDSELSERSDFVLTVPANDELVQPLLTVVPLQLLAYHAAVLRGCDVDKPRNLAKSVTVE